MPAVSPFPGMDPYLENTWRDVHASLITYTRDLLQGELAPGLRARMEERVVVENPAENFQRRGVYPDVHVFDQVPPGMFPPIAPGAWEHLGGTNGGGNGHGLTVAEPVVAEVDWQFPVETFLQIVDAQSGGEVVTIIEFLSPANKTWGPSRRQYLEKRDPLLWGPVSLVEIDLTRARGRFFPMDDAEHPAMRRVAYAACVHRRGQERRFELYPLPLHERLPVLRIPQRLGDPDVLLDVQVVVDLAYRNGRYDEDVDYRQPPPDPPLHPEDAAWLEARLRETGRRS